MTGYVQNLKSQYAFEAVNVNTTRPMQRLLDEAQALGRQIADLEALRASKLAAFERIKTNRQVEEMKNLALMAEYGRGAYKHEARQRLELYRRP